MVVGIVDLSNAFSKKLTLELGAELRVVAEPFVRLAQLGQRVHQRFRDKNTTVRAEVTRCVGQIEVMGRPAEAVNARDVVVVV